MKNLVLIKKICFVAVFTALSTVLYLGPKWPLPFFPNFLEINFSMLPIIIAAFMFGPIEGIIIVLLRFVVNIALEPTGSFYIGEITDVIIGFSTVTVTSITYRFCHFKHKDILALALGCVTWILAGALVNYFYCVPQYLELYAKGDPAVLINVLKVVPGINEDNYLSRYVLYACVPFNAILSVGISLITFIVHRRLEVFYKYVLTDKTHTNNETEE